MIGSPFYMSPEQILGSKGIDHRSDLWSVGVLSFEMLTGTRPFDAETMGGLAIKIHSQPLPSPTALNADLDPAVDAWFAKACAREIDQRFGSARELVEALSRALGGALPSSLDNNRPRIKPGGPAAADAVAPTLAAGTATDAGVAGPALQSRARSGFLVLLAIVVLVTPLMYFALRKTPKPADAALVVAHPTTPAPVDAPAGPAGPAPDLVSSAATMLTVATVPQAAAPSTPRPNPRPPRQHVLLAASAHVASPPSSAPSLPQVTVPATTSRPAPSGNDIF